MPDTIAFLFPGQGSQFVGMGRDLLDPFPEAKRVFEMADEICKKPISTLCFEGPMDELTLTENLQPAITVVNLACLLALNASGITPTVSAGHSLGEYAALVSAGVVSTEDALRLVHKRGELMNREALKHPGGMAAVIGLPINGVLEVLAQAKDGQELAIANHNTAQQIVITGEETAVSRAVQAVKERGAKAIPLNVSGAWHSRLMEGAVAEFRAFMEQMPFSTPKSRVLFNATAEKEKDPEIIKDLMANQLVTPVKWYDIMQNMAEAAVNIFLEVGPKKVLTGLLKKTRPRKTGVKIYNVQDARSLSEFLDTF
jgi:[acyl-carrier-protein] S-malonyltransferase